MTTIYPSRPNPLRTYSEAVDAAEALRVEELQTGVQAMCCTTLMTHGEATEFAVLILHGFTACPAQFAQLGALLFEQGHNVLMTRMPLHGLEDRLTRETKNITAAMLAEYGDRSLDVARGLGRHVLAMGISGGGTVACWLAQNRADLDIAMPIAAMLGLSFIPSWGTRAFSRLFHSIPDFYMWWDPRTRENNPYALPIAYPGYSVRAMSELLRLGVAVRDQASRQPPAARRIVMVVNDNEPGVSNTEINKLSAHWKAHLTATTLDSYHFEKALKLPHDLITPETPGLDYHMVNRRLALLVANETGVAAGSDNGQKEGGAI